MDSMVILNSMIEIGHKPQSAHFNETPPRNSGELVALDQTESETGYIYLVYEDEKTSQELDTIKARVLSDIDAFDETAFINP